MAIFGESWNAWARRHEDQCDRRHTDEARAASESRAKLYARIEESERNIRREMSEQFETIRDDVRERHEQNSRTSKWIISLLATVAFSTITGLLTVVGMLLHKNGIL